MSVPRRQTPVPPQEWPNPRPVGTRILISVLGGWAAAQCALWAFGLGEVSRELGVDPAGIMRGEAWRLVTGPLVHAGAAHFLLTLLPLFFFGRDLEPIFGRRIFLLLCAASAMLANLINCIALPTTLVFGATATTAAIVAAYATAVPELEHFIGWRSIGIRVRAKWFTVAILGFSVASLGSRTLLEYGPAGIAAGAGLGWFSARQLGFGNLFWYQRRRHHRREIALREHRMTPAEFITERVDPILDQITRDGMGSLTREQRQTLEQAPAKLAQPKSLTPE